MKMLGKIALIGAVTAITAPAMACDMHGGNGMFWTPMSHWQNFSPKASTIDPTFLDDEDPAFLGDTSGNFQLVAPPPRKVRPSFSGAADRASRAAKTRVMMAGKSSDSEEALPVETTIQTIETASTETESETDAQPIR